MALRKRWPSDSLRERRPVARASSYNTADHALKLLAGGVASAAQLRGGARKGARARRCCSCGSAAVCA
eukprot:1638091-Lingulodinium_polyedra.AAC.1